MSLLVLPFTECVLVNARKRVAEVEERVSSERKEEVKERQEKERKSPSAIYKRRE